MVIANTIPKLAMFEPITFPMAISGCPTKAARKLTTNSGADVPNDTTTTPITSLDTLKCPAKETLPRTRKSPLNMSKTKPRKRKM